MPAYIEGIQLRKELQFAVGKMIVYPPRHGCPRAAIGKPVYEPRYDDGCHGAHTSVVASLVPDVFGSIGLVAGAALVPFVTEIVDLGRSVR